MDINEPSLMDVAHLNDTGESTSRKVQLSKSEGFILRPGRATHTRAEAGEARSASTVVAAPPLQHGG